LAGKINIYRWVQYRKTRERNLDVETTCRNLPQTIFSPETMMGVRITFGSNGMSISESTVLDESMEITCGRQIRAFGKRRPKMDSAADLPQSFGPYRMGPRMGQGGTAWVFEGQYVGPYDYRMGVALKVAKPGFEGLLVQEAQLMRHIRHPNVVSILAFQQTSSHTLYVMERVHGMNLKQFLRANAPVPLFVCLDLAIQLCDAMTCLGCREGGMSIVHGDIKPTNIMVSPSGQLKVLDFGIATTSGKSNRPNSYGTPAYMAPEQISSKPLDARTDIFAFGAVLFELITGERLFPERDPARLVRDRLNVDRTLDLFRITTKVGARCPELCELIHRCVREKPVERFASFEPVGAALRVLVGTLPQTISVRTWWSRRCRENV
jgi:serine/threonine-protein kinase